MTRRLPADCPCPWVRHPDGDPWIRWPDPQCPHHTPRPARLASVTPLRGEAAVSDRLTVDTINSDQLDRLINLLERTGAYLDAIHGVGRHDSFSRASGPERPCTGCELREQIRTELTGGDA